MFKKIIEKFVKTHQTFKELQNLADSFHCLLDETVKERDSVKRLLSVLEIKEQKAREGIEQIKELIKYLDQRNKVVKEIKKICKEIL